MKTETYIRLETREHYGETKDLADCTDAELQKFFETKTQAELVRWVLSLIGFIREA